jgi:hypothetical protein
MSDRNCLGDVENAAVGAVVAAVTMAPVAVGVSMSRLEIMLYCCSQSQGS